jgi:hypothetical protein
MLAMGVVVLCVGAPAWADMSLTPSSAVSFQDEPSPQTADHTALLTSLDDQWAPTPVAGFEVYSFDFYATGTYRGYWDAASVSFDLSPIGWEHVASAELRFYTQQGGYPSQWQYHHYEILEGAFNSTHEDGDASLGWPGLVDFGDHGNNEVVGWLSEPIPLSWITDDSFDVTLRLWNARIDKIELDVVRAPLPGAVLLGLLGFGTAGSGLLLRRSSGRGKPAAA